MNRKNLFPFLFSLIMLAAVLFLVWYVPAVSGRAFQLEDLQKSLETSQGRERKQQFEYDKVVSEIPEIQAELDLIQPQTDAAEKEDRPCPLGACPRGPDPDLWAGPVLAGPGALPQIHRRIIPGALWLHDCLKRDDQYGIHGSPSFQSP